MSRFDQIIQEAQDILASGAEEIQKIDPKRVDAMVEMPQYSKDISRFTDEENQLFNAFKTKLDQVRKNTKPENDPNKPKAQWEIERDKYITMAQEEPEETQQTEEPTEEELTIEQRVQSILNNPLKAFESKFKTKNMPFLDIKKFNLKEFKKQMMEISSEVFSTHNQKRYDVFVYQVSHHDPQMHLICTKVPSITPGKEVIIWLRAMTSYREYTAQLDDFRRKQG
jgi:hypothetical protein